MGQDTDTHTHFPLVEDPQHSVLWVLKIYSRFLLNLGANISWGWLSSLKFSDLILILDGFASADPHLHMDELHYLDPLHHQHGLLQHPRVRRMGLLFRLWVLRRSQLWMEM